MRLHHRQRQTRPIDLLPLINVVFLLILFVLVAGRPTTGHPRDVLVAETRIEEEHRPTSVAIILRSDDRFYIGTRAVQLDDIVSWFAAKKIAQKGLAVELIAARDASAGALLAFRHSAARAGIGEIRVKTMLIEAQAGVQGGT